MSVEKQDNSSEIESLSPLISMRGVSKSYGKTQILHDITLDVVRGETLVFLGPSGGGKSTLLRCISGLSCFDQGTIQIGECCLKASSDDSTAQKNAKNIFGTVGMIFQDIRLFPHLTAEQNVMQAPVFVRGLSEKSAKEQARQLLAMVGLNDKRTYLPRELSGGQQQRVAIARALAMKPSVLLCDEVTSALDPQMREEVLSILEKLKKDGLTLLMVTHEMSFAQKAADRVIVLKQGQIKENTSARNFFTKSSSLSADL